MSDADTTTQQADTTNAVGSTTTAERGAGAWLLAGLMAGAGATHFAMAPSHASAGILEPLGFAAAGWFQFAVAAAVVARRATRPVLLAAVAGNLALIGLWAWSRLVGLPVGAHPFEPEAVGNIDVLVVGLQVAAIVVALVMLASPGLLRLTPVAGGVAAVAVLGLATAAVVSPEAAEHGHGGDGHGHGTDAIAEMVAIDEARCDTDFNVASYYTETAVLGIDTYTGGHMADDHHGHGSMIDTVLTPDPLGGRGSVHLDTLVSLSSQAISESAAGAVVAELAYATDAEYAAWLQWLKADMAGHDHDASAPGDNDGHGGHLGPQAWKAMMDPAECDQLAEEIELARATALQYPTAADAMAAGYRRVTTYIPGIASHYMNFAYVDGVFEIDKPEMLLYDGDEPDASLVGLSYYVMLVGDAEPTQGFTGSNDHYHRHVGLCMRGGVVVGDTTLTEEECAERGGRKSGGSAGWMSHAWVVPGCESPWGLFSAANPVLTRQLGEASGTDGGGCAASGVSERYDLTPGRPDTLVLTGTASGIEQAAAGD